LQSHAHLLLDVAALLPRQRRVGFPETLVLKVFNFLVPKNFKPLTL
jgi:hypothetical protein